MADSLEADWNDKLKLLAEAQRVCELVDEEQLAAILSLTTDFPQLWRDPSTPDREQKRMVRLLLEDVTLGRADGLTLHIRFKGGAQHTIHLPVPSDPGSRDKPVRRWLPPSIGCWMTTRIPRLPLS